MVQPGSCDSGREHKVPRWEKPRIHLLPGSLCVNGNQAKNDVQDTIETLSYDKNKLQHKVERAEPSAEERRSAPHSDVTGVMAQLTDLVQATHKLTKPMAQYMEKSKEWLTSRN